MKTTNRHAQKYCFLFVMLTSFICLFSHAGADSQKTKIAVLDFQMQGEKFETGDIGKIVAEWITTCLVETGRFDVVERRLLQKIIEEQKVSASGLIDPGSAAQVGKMLGAKHIITGAVLSVGKRIEINARIISVEEGAIIAAVNVIADSESKLRQKVAEVGGKIVSAFPIDGYILKRSKDKVVLDLGAASGIREGMRFLVVKEGNVIKHPKTGKVVDVEIIKVGELELKEIGNKTSTCIILKEVSSKAVEEGMTVKSIPDKQEVSLPSEDLPKPTIPLPGL